MYFPALLAHPIQVRLASLLMEAPRFLVFCPFLIRCRLLPCFRLRCAADKTSAPSSIVAHRSSCNPELPRWCPPVVHRTSPPKFVPCVQSARDHKRLVADQPLRGHLLCRQANWRGRGGAAVLSLISSPAMYGFSSYLGAPLAETSLIRIRASFALLFRFIVSSAQLLIDFGDPTTLVQRTEELPLSARSLLLLFSLIVELCQRTRTPPSPSATTLCFSNAAQPVRSI